MKILITGHTGFIGSHLLSELIKKHNVFGLSLENGNILNKNDLEKFRNVDYCYHLAAVSTFDKAEQNPNEAIATNVIGTKNVVEFCRKSIRGS